MDQNSVAVKVVLMLRPEKLQEQQSILGLLQIEKSMAGVDYKQHPLDQESITAWLGHLSYEARQALKPFDEEYLKFELYQARRKYARERSGVSEEVYSEKIVQRCIHGWMETLRPFTEELKLYHRVRHPETGNYRISLCRLMQETPVLSFEVIRSDEGELSVRTLLQIDDMLYPLESLERTKFLIRHEAAYYILEYRDFLTLEWLFARDTGRYGQDHAGFAQHILSRLEADYPVRRNGHFSQHVIDTEPLNCIYVSEISGSFLMLTPRWDYDGILVEGVWKEKHETARNGVLYTICRNREAEQQFLGLLQSLHPSFAKQLNGYFYLSFAEAGKKQWFLKTYHRLLESDVSFIGLELLQHFRYSPYGAVTETAIADEDEITIRLRMRISFGKETVSLSEVQKILLAGQRNILLKDNSIGILNDEWQEQYGVLVKHGKISQDQLSIPRWIFLNIGTAAAEAGRSGGKRVFRREWLDRWIQYQQPEKQVYRLPQEIRAELRPYQHKGFEWMVLLSEIGAGACLADDMGLGKTLQSIAFLMHRYSLDRKIKCLIVCPASLIHNWEQELRKFAPELVPFIYNGIKRNFDEFFKGEKQIAITGYGTMRSDIEKIKLVGWDTVILDESHNVKNPQALITKAVMQLGASCRIALSGTPVMNNTFDLYAQLGFLLPGMFGSREFFKREYADPIDREQDEEKMKALQQLTAPFILRRTKAQVASDLPARTEMILWCEMGEPQKAVYEKIRNSIRDSVFLNIKQGGLAKAKLQILQGMQKLRQVCCSPQLLKDPEINCSESVKVDMLMEELEENLRNNKALIFSQFKGMLHLLAEACRRKGIPYFHFDGDTPVIERSRMVNAFQQEGGEERVFLISLMAGNAGLNLTAADYVFLADPWWNVAVQQQAIDRTHRIGQDKSVFAYKMICKDTIEERIIEIQQKKKALSEELISVDEGFVKTLTEEDVVYLFG